MTTNAARFAAGLALIAFGAPVSAYGQFAPPLIIVPPAQQYYGSPKPAPEPERATRPKPPPPDTPPQKTRGHYQGRTWVPD